MSYYKKIILIIGFTMISFLLCSCTPKDISDTVKISSPDNYEMPLTGDWVVSKQYNKNLESGNSVTPETEASVGKIVSINKNDIVLFDKECFNPEFKIKTVDSKSYLVSKFEINPEALDISQSEIQIVTVTQKDNFFASFIMLDKDNIITYIDGFFYHLVPKLNEDKNNNQANKKESNIKSASQSNKVQDRIINSEKLLYSSEIQKQLSSGILLGLKSYESKGNNIEIPVYRTLWINLGAYSEKPSIDVIPRLIVPRKSGFWFVDVENKLKSSHVESSIFVYPINKNIQQKSQESGIINGGQAYTGVDIFFIGNDYISLELNGSKFNSNANNSNTSFLRLYALDTINSKNSSPIIISNLLGEDAIKALNQGAAAYLTSLNFNERQKMEQIPSNYSFGIIRRNGKWVLRGRLNELDILSEKSSENSNLGDFDIPIILTKDIVAYDSLYPSWSIIKEMVPEAVDAYSSPNRHYVIVITKTSLIVYNVTDGRLGSSPLLTFNLNSKENIIMSQWSTGSYVRTWDEQMKKLIKQ
ncbi:hypothetical protein CLHOM_26860 [Clostridium homopropionicum DSM 5847]|uniref:Lipoprotein n=1 Tax=Clostridium homopropionicum DSM 5847 TaxID=1121318 RepID=A0A0L6Z7K1_9CLOT|nr:hypothetical protein [Clostridium homopropionicum]KOA18946.1 hypothetical protein CLHOM_26860 [Clostridium homopropionicum DSM 5847]SFG43720.1 hypothetical protein SAMN04488501_10968 [Clostridium homopropionicum]